MTITRITCACIVSSFLLLTAFSVRAETIKYTLDNLFLNDGEQITGTFDWVFNADDFQGGSGVFTALEIPYTIYSFAEGSLDYVIETKSIEISGNLNYHDAGLDITLVFPQSQPLSPTQSVPIDLSLSRFECCGNGFKDQSFRSGSVSPSATPPNGVCGASHGATLTAAPTTDLCGNGTATEVTGNGPWSWACESAYGGSDANCSAAVQTYGITATASPVTGGTVSCTRNPVNHGSSSTCTASDNADYVFDGFSGDCTGVSCTLSNVTATRTVTANFATNDAGVPSQPTITSIEPEDSALLVRFTITSDGGSPITSYTVTCGGISASGSDSPITVTGPTNGQEYSCSVVATNAIGSSSSSALVSEKPEEMFRQGLPVWLLYDATKPRQPPP